MILDRKLATCLASECRLYVQIVEIARMEPPSPLLERSKRVNLTYLDRTDIRSMPGSF